MRPTLPKFGIDGWKYKTLRHGTEGSNVKRQHMGLNQVLYLQTEIAHLYMKRHNLSPAEFSKIDKKYGILEFLETGYEVFHLSGPEGVLNEVEDYIGSIKNPV